MQIVSSNIAMQSVSSRTESRQDIRSGPEPPAGGNASAQETAQEASRQVIEGQKIDVALVAGYQTNSNQSVQAQDPILDNLLNEGTEVRFIRLLLEKMTGMRLADEAYQPLKLSPEQLNFEFRAISESELMVNLDMAPVAPDQTVTRLLDVSESYEFEVSGNISLADGSTLSVDLSSYRQSEYTLDITQNFQDPLVIQLTPGEIELTSERIGFDLDSDGETQESIFFVTGNSRFLALDRDQNGQIDSGAELFGAVSGNGYQELAVFDEDGNGFIDAGDSVFSQLQLIAKDSQGNDLITSLKDAGIGAIYLSSAATPLGIEKSGVLAAQVRASSFYLTESGRLGATHQVDLLV